MPEVSIIKFVYAESVVVPVSTYCFKLVANVLQSIRSGSDIVIEGLDVKSSPLLISVNSPMNPLFDISTEADIEAPEPSPSVIVTTGSLK